MGNAIKLVSGFILFVIGVLISYETYTYNLVDILLIVGLLIIVIGMVLIASYIVESNVDKTANKIKEFLDSKEVNQEIKALIDNDYPGYMVWLASGDPNDIEKIKNGF